ncbi:hypothetical protein IDH44_10285 [Paenibacillus sp. IB182496]|uniref:Uncharacterized protein n=1 Tax=Paenibacillus sabuli TaxID=2772509 RepID=A0A927BRS3_9BACL|nr:hypothetical protein [Paenibacillus sabuli]MBD2845578.1 hypothetical protein [Paenibacillus sabuli]
MDPSDNELRELRSGPLAHHGFDERLQQRILERAEDSGPRGTRHYRLPRIAGACAALAVLVVALLYGLDGFTPGEPAPLAFDQTDAPKSGQGATILEADTSGASFQSAVLVGLRADHPAEGGRTAYSEYRTVLVAPDDSGELSRAAEGGGILMPYKTEFWRIEEQTAAVKDKEVQILSAAPAAPRGASISLERRELVAATEDASAKEKAVDAMDAARQSAERTSAAIVESGSGVTRTGHTDRVVRIAASTEDAVEADAPASVESAPVIVSEKLLFAGNLNVAIEQRVADPSDPAAAESAATYLWVKQVDQFAGSRELGADPAGEPHVAIAEVFPDLAEDDGRDAYYGNWTIARNPGRWIARRALTDAEASGGAGYRLQDVLQPLPSGVVAHDKLAVAWEEIWQREPDASDAFSSPAADTVMVVTDGRLAFYLNGEGLAYEPALELELQDDETVVMAQWARMNYVEKWREEAGRLLGVSQQETDAAR